MSCRSPANPHVREIEQEEEEELVASMRREIDYLNIDTDESDVEEIPLIHIPDAKEYDIPSKPLTPQQLKKPRRSTSKPSRTPDVEIRSYQLGCGVINIGDTVELADAVDHKDDGTMHSGDFLRVKHIIQDTETGETRVNGHRIRRAKYLTPLIELKFNDLVMVLHVTEDDRRCAFVQGQIEVPVSSVVAKRVCIITSKSYNLVNFRHVLEPSVIGNLGKALPKEELKQVLFNQAPVTCRYVYIQTMTDAGKSYEGVVRSIYTREADEHPFQKASVSSSMSATVVSSEEDNDSELFIVDDRRAAWSALKRRPRSDSLEELDGPPPKVPLPRKTIPYTFGDAFCGVGGASEGAAQAGLSVSWGLDNNEAAIQAYAKNHLGAKTLSINAHDFGDHKDDSLRVDVLHLSPPCCYWSPAHTNDGQNDQANYEALYTVGPIIRKLKPRVATLEQTYGLLTSEKHHPNFRNLIKDIHEAGYDVRYKIQDLSELGLPQRRKRLLMIAARRGQPLPPFPKPTHGDASSGLKRYVSVYDALDPIRRTGPMTPPDIYHQPSRLKSTNKPAYDPANTLLPGCITTSGGPDNYHSSGKRRHTVRENALFQGFPYKYIFTGSQTEAMKQVGNAFPPVVAAAMYKTIAQTLEAFDHGFINAEDDIYDLDTKLDLLDIDIPGSEDTPIDLLNPIQVPVWSPYKYLTRSPAKERQRQQSRTPGSSKKRCLFGKGNGIEPRSERERMRSSSRKKRRGSAYAGFELFGEGQDEGSPSPTSSPSPSPNSNSRPGSGQSLSYRPQSRNTAFADLEMTEESAFADLELTEEEKLWLAKENAIVLDD